MQILINLWNILVMKKFNVNITLLVTLTQK